MPKTLVTGANSFVAAHIIDQLIILDHSVTGSVRSPLKGQQIIDLHPTYKNHFSFIIVSDYATPGTWDQVFKDGDFDYVIHTAAPLLDNPRNTDFDRDFLEPAVKGVTELLKSATKHGQSLKSVIVTGSINAVTTGEDIATRTFTSEEWLPVTPASARAAQNPYISYCVAKASAEHAIWDYVAAIKPTYSVTVLLPALIFGPPIQPVFDLKHVNYSTDVFYSLFNGTYDVVPNTSFGSYIDVRDLALAHILSLDNASVANKRLLVGGLPYSSQLAVNVLKTLPELKGRLPKDNDEVVTPVKFGDVEAWNQKLGLVVKTPAETFTGAALKVLELEKKLSTM
jgi:nucleoside-diphosphate-sugar epimerase